MKKKTSLQAYVEYRAALLNMRQREVAKRSGMCPNTLRARMQQPETMTLDEFRRVMTAIKAPDYEREQRIKEVIG